MTSNRRWLYLVGSLLMAAGLALAVYCIGLSAGRVISAVIDRDSRSPLAAPSSVVGRLQHGSYLIMQQTGRIDYYGNRIDLTPVTIRPDQVTIRSFPAGVGIPVYPASDAYDDQGGISFTAVAGFTVGRTGEYQIAVTGPDTNYLVVRTLAPVFHATAGPLVATALGGTIFLAGLITVIVGIARSRPVKTGLHWYGGSVGIAVRLPYASGMAATKTRRLELRTDEDTEQLVNDAAALLQISKTAFVEDAVRTAAHKVLARADVTLMDPAVFDVMMGALHHPEESAGLAELASLPQLIDQ
ncbi:MAG TPA: DUF1778 domain-containing protein [Jatrophihabitans sp.]|nr:DUF1778 domain-containing protein [Jatrophihabitans sp.]